MKRWFPVVPAFVAVAVVGFAFPVVLGQQPAVVRHAAALPADSEGRLLLWDPAKPVPTASEIPLLAGVQFHVVKPYEPEQDGYRWLHGVALAWYNGLLYASFGHNQGAENTASEQARCCLSRDGGRTWTEPWTIDAGDEPNLAVSHGVFLTDRGTLWAFHGSFFHRLQDVHMRGYRLADDGRTWQPLGVVARDGFWPMQAAQKMDDGNWIVAGVSVRGQFGGTDDLPAVAISAGDDFTTWQVHSIANPKGLEIWGESAVVIHGRHLLCIARYGKRAVALAATSSDFGRTWTDLCETNLPMTPSKPCVGTLSTGQHYLICTTTANSGFRRNPLTIAVSPPGCLQFDRIYRIRDAVFAGPGESHPRAALAYPYAIEHEGKLFVAYSNDGGRGANHNSAELAIIPLQSLQAGAEQR